MGKVYYDLGFLAKDEVVHVSATDLIGEYIGHTGPKTKKLLESALGRVLFIDEAYRLADSSFAKEAIDELVDSLTKPAFAGKLIVILAGYTDDINRLMATNPGLTSRFPETVDFNHLTPEECKRLLLKQLKAKKHLDTRCLEPASVELEHNIFQRFATLSSLANWANARDVETVAKSIFSALMSAAVVTSKDSLFVDEKTVLGALDDMVAERRGRASNGLLSPRGQGEAAAALPSRSAPPPSTSTALCTDSGTSEGADQEEVKPRSPTADDLRDPGVPDDQWNSLQEAKQLAEAERQRYGDLLKQQEKQQVDHARLRAKEEEEEREAELRHQQLKQSEDDEERRRLEQERLARVNARRQREEELARIEAERKRVEAERRKEQEAQKKLKSMGVCPVGFQWLKQQGGYRCAGGSHFVSDAQLVRG